MRRMLDAQASTEWVQIVLLNGPSSFKHRRAESAAAQAQVPNANTPSVSSCWLLQDRFRKNRPCAAHRTVRGTDGHTRMMVGSRRAPVQLCAEPVLPHARVDLRLLRPSGRLVQRLGTVHHVDRAR